MSKRVWLPASIYQSHHSDSVSYDIYRWIDVTSTRLRVPADFELDGYAIESKRRARTANQSIADALLAEKPEVYTVIKETIDAVAYVRHQIMTTLIELDVIPLVLHPLVARYAI
jgi:hypothetical protein